MQLVARCDVLRLAYRLRKKKVYFITAMTAMPKNRGVKFHPASFCFNYSTQNQLLRYSIHS